MCSGNGSPCSGFFINCCGGGAPQNPPCAGIGFVVNGIDRALGEMVTTADMAIGTTQTFTVGIKNPGAVALVVSNIQFVNAMPPGAATSGVVFSTNAVFPLTVPAGSSTQVTLTITSGSASGMTDVLMSVTSNACGANNAILGFTTKVNDPVYPCQQLLVQANIDGAGYVDWFGDGFGNALDFGRITHGGSKTVRLRATNYVTNSPQQIRAIGVNGNFDPDTEQPTVSVSVVPSSLGSTLPITLGPGQSMEFDVTFDVSALTNIAAIDWNLQTMGNFGLNVNGCNRNCDLFISKDAKLVCTNLAVFLCDVATPTDGCWIAPFTASAQCYSTDPVTGDSTFTGLSWNRFEQGNWVLRLQNTRADIALSVVVSAIVQNNVLLNTPGFGVIHTIAPGQQLDLPVSVQSDNLGDFALGIQVQMPSTGCTYTYNWSGVTSEPCLRVVYAMSLTGGIGSTPVGNGDTYNVPAVAPLGVQRVVLDITNNNDCKNVNIQTLTATVVQNNLGSVVASATAYTVMPQNIESGYIDFTAGTVTGAYTIQVDITWVGGCAARFFINGTVV